MIDSSQGGAEAVSSEFQLYRIVCFARAKEHPEHPLWICHCCHVNNNKSTST